MLPVIRVRFHPLETALPNHDAIGGTVDCTTHRGTYVHLGIQYDTIEYRFSYEENPGEGCFFMCPKSPACGYHLGDTERVILLTMNNRIEHVFFKAHETGQGMWLPWNRCNKDLDGNLILYVARGSHASYPEPQTYLRIFGFANDQCSDRGLDLLTNVTGEHPNPYAMREYSITPLQRFFLPFVLLYIQNQP